METVNMATRAACGLVRQFSTSAAGLNLAKPPIQVFGLSGRYANALYSAAVKEKKLDVVEKELGDIQKLLQTDKILDEFLRNPTIPRALKRDAVTSEVICEVVTAKPLDAALQKEVSATLKSFLEKGQVIKLKSSVDPSIVGGMIVTVGDKYIDMSISSKLKLYTDLINQPI